MFVGDLDISMQYVQNNVHKIDLHMRMKYAIVGVKIGIQLNTFN